MKKSTNIIQIAALAVLALILAAGCITEKDTPSMDAKDVMILLDLSADEMHTKAMDESAIKTVRVFAFDKNGKQVGHAYSSEPGNGSFHMALSTPDGATSMDVDFYAVANEGAMYYDGTAVALSENTTKDELDELVYSSLITTLEALPMYGKVEGKTLSLTAGRVHTIDDHTGFLLTEKISIKMFRSLAKIGVYVAAMEGTVNDPIVHSITFKASGRRNISYLFPSDNLMTRDASITSLTSDRVFDLVADGKDMLSNAGVVTKRLDAQDMDPTTVVEDLYTEILSPFYLAEVPYGSSAWDVPADESGRPVVLVVEYSLGEGSLKKYAAVNMPAIERNNFYQVRCLIKTDGQILADVSVNPWEAGEDWDIAFDFPTHSNPLVATSTILPDGTYPSEYGKKATMYFAGSEAEPEEDGAFSVDFNMSYPIGGRWQPVLNHASTDDYKVLVYKRGETAQVSTPIMITSEKDDTWYTIKVVPLKNSKVGDKVTLSISYITSWGGSDHSYLLQINGGEENNLAWIEDNPQDNDAYEASTVDIVITQVDTPTGN